MTEFKIEYDDQPEYIIEKIDEVLRKNYGLAIYSNDEEQGNGYIKYKIKPIEEEE